ncbi:MAG: hypothetical protein PHP55_05210 [Methanoculleus sp.]|nr:hypothetical protein [Methanoculleus sp.]
MSAQSIDDRSTDKGAVFITTSFADPIDQETLKNMRNDAIDTYATKHGEEPMGGADPVVPDGSAIVAYGFVIDEKGVPHQYVGIAANNESVSAVHDKAEEWRKRYIETDLESPAMGIMSLRSLEWGNPVYFNEGDYYYHPYGGVTNNFEMFKHPSDNNPSRDWFAIHQISAMEPGIQRWGTEYMNFEGNAIQDWSISTAGDPELHSWSPMSDTSGSQTIQVSLSPAPALSWSYAQGDVTTYTHTSTDTEIAHWRSRFNSVGTKTTTQGIEPGSSCATDQHSSGQYDIVYLNSTAQFMDIWGYGYGETIWYWWQLWYQY